jgi:hypothetical protein
LKSLEQFSEIFTQFDKENAKPLDSGSEYVPYYFPENGLMESEPVKIDPSCEGLSEE